MARTWVSPPALVRWLTANADEWTESRFGNPEPADNSHAMQTLQKKEDQTMESGKEME